MALSQVLFAIRMCSPSSLLSDFKSIKMCFFLMSLLEVFTLFPTDHFHPSEASGCAGYGHNAQ